MPRTRPSMLAAVMLLSACADLPQRLVLQPSVSTVESDAVPVTVRQEVFLRVIDSRIENTLGCFESGGGNAGHFLLPGNWM